MEHIKWIDNLRGLAFIGMVIHHIYYLYDVSNNTNIISNNVENIGFVARNIFILLAGISLYLSTKKKNYIKKRFERSTKILIHALIISYISFILFPDKWIRFGFLHFFALATLLLVFISEYPTLLIIALIIFSIGIPPINKNLDVIIGGSVPYNAIDWAPLNQYFPLLIVGVLIGHLFGDKLNFDIGDKGLKVLETIGSNSLELYTAHFIFLLGLYG
jgi:uncharacterized membrane protein